MPSLAGIESDMMDQMMFPFSHWQLAYGNRIYILLHVDNSFSL